MAGEEWTPEEIMGVVGRDRGFYEASGGGMTLSGGEPLWQSAGAGRLLELARGEGIHTAVETCGCVEWPVVRSVLELVDVWLFDVKELDPGAHRAMTGSGNEGILANLDGLLAAGARVIVRVPVVPGRNDGVWLVERLPRWLRERPRVREVHLMPYNRLAESKYRSLGVEYALAGLEAPTDEELEAVKARLEGVGVRVRVGG